jgi:DNA uptake protein ComE-like DNA-binding protein
MAQRKLPQGAENIPQLIEKLIDMSYTDVEQKEIVALLEWLDEFLESRKSYHKHYQARVHARARIAQQMLAPDELAELDRQAAENVERRSNALQSEHSEADEAEGR